LWNAILRIKETLSLKKEVEILKEQLEEKHSFSASIIGNSPAIKKTFVLLEKASKTNINFSKSGETGTGKEVYAKAIHYNSDRKKAPFVAVNMAAIPSELMESELFGHEKGAFTGAVQRKPGKFEEANGGTLFLDEIAELDLALQSKILRALQEREITRLGGNDKIKLNIRLITATHRDLAAEVQAGRFREDLYFRIIGLPLHLPPLRDRGADVLLLAKHFTDLAAADNHMKPPALSAGAKEKLLQYRYPGNVRELKAAMDLAVVMCEGKEITEKDIMFSNLRQGAPPTAFGGEAQGKTLRQYTIEIIAHYLEKNKYNVLEVAKILDIGKSTIYGMIKNKEVTIPNS
jgi:DNA-binding NtrC family response regulator